MFPLSGQDKAWLPPTFPFSVNIIHYVYTSDCRRDFQFATESIDSRQSEFLRTIQLSHLSVNVKLISIGIAECVKAPTEI